MSDVFISYSRDDAEEANRLRLALKSRGFAVWWEANMVEGVTLSTAPGAAATHWEQLYFPLLTPIACKAGETLKVALRSRSSEAEGTHLAWKATLQDAQGKTLQRQALDLDKGYLP